MKTIKSGLFCFLFLNLAPLLAFSGELEDDLAILKQEIERFSMDLEGRGFDPQKELFESEESLAVLQSKLDEIKGTTTPFGLKLKSKLLQRREDIHEEMEEVKNNSRLFAKLSEMRSKTSDGEGCRDFNLGLHSIKNDIQRMKAQIEDVLSKGKFRTDLNVEDEKFQDLLIQVCRFKFLVNEYQKVFTDFSRASVSKLEELDKKYNFTPFCVGIGGQDFDSNHPNLKGLSSEQVQVLKRYGFLPKYEVIAKERYGEEVKEKKYFLTDFFKTVEGREFCWAVFPFNGKTYIRLIWKSGSQGIFKFTYGLNFDKSFDGLKLKMIDKTPGSSYLTVPQELQEFLFNEYKTRVSKRFIDLYGNHFVDEMQRVAPSEDVLAFKKFKKFLIDSVPKEFVNDKLRARRPVDLQLREDQHKPDFKEERTFEGKTLGEPITVYVYPSKDDSLEYLFVKDKDNYVWVADVHLKHAPTNSLGISRIGLETHELTAPVWEYSKQIPKGYERGVLRNRRYKRQDAYVNLIPTVDEWYQAHKEVTRPHSE